MNYKDLDVWHSARDLAKCSFKLIGLLEERKCFSLANQLQRSAISIPSNIAEGSGRQYKKETIQFLNISRGSLYELETQIILVFDLDLIQEEELNFYLKKVERCLKLIHGYIRYLRKHDLK